MQYLSYFIQIWGLVVDGMTRNKAGRPWWSVIIPFYSTYVTFEMAGKKKLFWPVLAIAIVDLILVMVMIFSFIGIVVAQIPQILDPGFDYRSFDFKEFYDSFMEHFDMTSALVPIGAMLLSGLLSIVSCAFMIIADCSLAKAFGYEGAFGIGLFFLPAIFYSILAFGSHTYTDPSAPPPQPQQNTTYYANYNG